MAELFKLNIGRTFIFEDHNCKLQTGGHVYTQTMRLAYHGGDGIIFTADQILYTEGTIGGPQDFLEIRSYSDITLSDSGYVSVRTTCQTNVPSGTVVTKTISAGGSLPFDFTIYYS